MVNLEKLYAQINRKAFKNKGPREIDIKFKRMRDLGNTDYIEVVGSDPENVKIRVNERLSFSECLCAQVIIHEVAHLISGKTGHKARFYRVYFKAARRKQARGWF